MQVQSMNDAAFCGKVPLHQTNLIQPHGFLLVADKDFRFIQVVSPLHFKGDIAFFYKNLKKGSYGVRMRLGIRAVFYQVF